MTRGTTIFLKISLILFGIIVISLSLFALPRLARDAVESFPEFSYLQYPVLVGVNGTVVPFVMALVQAYQLLQLIEEKTAFSERAVELLRKIKYNALIIVGVYVIGMVVLMTQSALHPGVALMGLSIIFASLIISVFSTVLQELLKKATEIKTENDLTV
ncbi:MULTISPECIES: DUF2975 domain-containing protein [Pontibacillus]|uniref:DUF2975 domain-containing protein n=1 Tax=Pontibacillus chungwhensis TaxID=265426 RepID=A0ABY8V0Y1_9BACI|nr:MULTISPECIES: DUF2975 domain-containing protein [Pontibacillus]MCD5322308.1 DUF2975 domain-containing protein [Pontibacillus sp. HN14]WIF99600.1 DUF2975 domain-containing protein [Pontibacillus chungwhensis]